MKKASKQFDESSSDSYDEAHDFKLQNQSNINMYITSKVGKYRIKKLLRETDLSAVFELTDDNYVMKFIPRHIYEDCKQEVYLMKELDEDGNYHIMKCHDFILKDRYAAIVMPRAESDLFIYVSPKSSNLDVHYICSIIKSTLEALSYLHEQGIWHRDIKLENILIMKQTENGPIINVSDFGISYISESDPQNFKTLKCVGTTVYAAPELIERDPSKKYGVRFKNQVRYNCTIDIWSLGIVAYFLFTKRHPFIKDDVYDLDAAENHQIDFDLEGENPFGEDPELVIEVISAMLNPSPSGRCNANEALGFEWFKSFRTSKPMLFSTVSNQVNQYTQLILNEKQA